METPFHVRSARESGMTPGRIRSRDFLAPFHGVRVSAAEVLTPERLCRAYAVKMRRDAAFSHETAAILYGVPLPASAPHSAIHVSVPLGTAPVRGRGVVGHHHPDSVSSRSIGRLRVTDPVSTWIALGSRLSLPDLVAAGDWMVSAHALAPPLVSIPDLAGALVLRRGCRGAARLRRALTYVREGAASRPESLLRVLLESAGIDPPHLNHPLGDLRVRIDLAWPEARFGIEYDGGHHRHPAQFVADVGRHERIHDHGWLLMRVTKESLFGDPLGVVRRVAARLADRGSPQRRPRLSHVVIPRP